MSRDAQHIERILQAMRYAWLANPDQRLCQLISNAVNRPADTFYVEDDDLAHSLRTYAWRDA